MRPTKLHRVEVRFPTVCAGQWVVNLPKTVTPTHGHGGLDIWLDTCLTETVTPTTQISPCDKSVGYLPHRDSDSNEIDDTECDLGWILAS